MCFCRAKMSQKLLFFGFEVQNPPQSVQGAKSQKSPSRVKLRIRISHRQAVNNVVRDITLWIFNATRTLITQLAAVCRLFSQKSLADANVNVRQQLISFHRAMHFSAKRGIAIACRLSVCPSVTLVNCDRIGWNSSKIISPLVSLGCSLFATLTWRVCSKGTHPKFGPKVTHPPVDLSVGDIRSQIAAEGLQIAQRSQWRAYRKLPSLFLMVPSLTPYDLSFPPKRGFHMPPT